MTLTGDKKHEWCPDDPRFVDCLLPETFAEDAAAEHTTLMESAKQQSVRARTSGELIYMAEERESSKVTVGSALLQMRRCFA